MMVWALLLGCSKQPSSTAPGLTDRGAEVEAMEPATIVREAAASEDPDRRGRALAWWVASAAPTDLPDLVQRGLYDPTPTVQRAVFRAALEREVSDDVLVAAYERSTTDPYVRAQIAQHLKRTPVEADWSGLITPWARAPLAILADDEDARASGLGVLGRGDVRADPLWFSSLIDIHIEGLDNALERALSTEPELALLAAFTLHARESRAGVSVIKRALTSADPSESLEAVELAHRFAPDLLPLGTRNKAEDARLVAELHVTPERVLDTAYVHPSTVVRAAAMQAAHGLLSATSKGKVERLATTVLTAGRVDASPVVRVAAIGPTTPIEALMAGRTDRDATVRLESAGRLWTGQQTP